VVGQFYRIGSKNVFGGPGRLLVAPYGSPRPAKISDIIDLTSYDLKDGAGWREVGATSDGIAPSRGFDTDDVEVDQSIQPIDQTITAWTNTLSTNLVEDTIENRQLAMVGSAIQEVPPALGTATTQTGATAIGATVLTLTAVTGITVGSYVKVGDEVKKVALVDSENKKITLSTPLLAAHEAEGTVTPITELGYKKISYGAPSEVPEFQMALLAMKKDGSIYAAVFYRCKVSGDDVERTYQKGTLTIPFNVVCNPVDDLPEDSNVFIEFEQNFA
jgi:hypothetical protein